MSHIVQLQTQIRDASALSAACRRLEIAPPTLETVQLFSSEATGHCVRLPNWRYPVVCQLETGEMAFDDFKGRWGDRAELDRLLQSYAIEKTRLESHRQGYTIFEQPLEDGSVKLIVHLSEGA